MPKYVLFINFTLLFATFAAAAPPVVVCLSGSAAIPATVTSAASVEALYCSCGAVVVDVGAWTVPGTFFAFRNGTVGAGGFFHVRGAASAAAAAALAPAAAVTVAHSDLTNNGAVKVQGTFPAGTRIDILGNRVLGSGNNAALGTQFSSTALILLQVRLLMDASLLIRLNSFVAVKNPSLYHIWTAMIHWVVAAEPNALVAIEGNTFIANKTLTGDVTSVWQTWNTDGALNGSSNSEYVVGFHALAPNATVLIQRNHFEVLDPFRSGYNAVSGVNIAQMSAIGPRSEVRFADNRIYVPATTSSFWKNNMGLYIDTSVVAGCGAVLSLTGNVVNISSESILSAYGIVLSNSFVETGLLVVDDNSIDTYGIAASPITIGAGSVATFGLLRVSNNRLTAHHASPTVPFAFLTVTLSGWGQVLFAGNAAVSAIVPTVTRPLLQGVLSGGDSAPNDVQVIGNTWYGAAAVAGPAFSVSGTAVAHTDLSQTTPFHLRRHACRNTWTASGSLAYTGGSTTATKTASPKTTITPRATLTNNPPPSPTLSASLISTYSAATGTHAPPPTATAPATVTHRTHSPSAFPEASPTVRCEPPEHRTAAVVLPLSAFEAGAPLALRFATTLPALAAAGHVLVLTWAGDADVVVLLAGTTCRPSADTLDCARRPHDNRSAAHPAAERLRGGGSLRNGRRGRRRRVLQDRRVPGYGGGGAARGGGAPSGWRGAGGGGGGAAASRARGDCARVRLCADGRGARAGDAGPRGAVQRADPEEFGAPRRAGGEPVRKRGAGRGGAAAGGASGGAHAGVPRGGLRGAPAVVRIWARGTRRSPRRVRGRAVPRVGAVDVLGVRARHRARHGAGGACGDEPRGGAGPRTRVGSRRGGGARGDPGGGGGGAAPRAGPAPRALRGGAGSRVVAARARDAGRTLGPRGACQGPRRGHGAAARAPRAGADAARARERRDGRAGDGPARCNPCVVRRAARGGGGPPRLPRRHRRHPASVPRAAAHRTLLRGRARGGRRRRRRSRRGRNLRRRACDVGGRCGYFCRLRPDPCPHRPRRVGVAGRVPRRAPTPRSGGRRFRGTAAIDPRPCGGRKALPKSTFRRISSLDEAGRNTEHILTILWC